MSDWALWIVLCSRLSPIPPRRPKAGSLQLIDTTLWIGKQDHLIHQARTHLKNRDEKMAESDANIAAILLKMNKPATPEAVAELRGQMEAQVQKGRDKGFVFTETHDNISVNQTFSNADFAR